jgi:voltage-gated potassium channel
VRADPLEPAENIDTEPKDRLAPRPVIPTEPRAAARRSLARSGVVVIGLVIGYALIPLRGEHWWVGAAIGVAAIVGVIPITIRRFHAVRRAVQPIVVAVEAIVLLVSMLILGFAAVYYAMDADQGQLAGLVTRVDSVYFTVTTLSTVGYGDIHATGTAARVLVTVQILVNLAFLGIVVRVMARAAGAMK